MTIAILYESKEWSNLALCEYINNYGVNSYLVDLEDEVDMEKLLSCKMVVNRMFPSAQIRNHMKSFIKTKFILDTTKDNNIPLINSYESYYYDTSKELTCKILNKSNLPSPAIYNTFNTSETPMYDKIKYPCILKPNCGGRSSNTYIIETERELCNILDNIDYNTEFICQKFIKPVKGYITRIEVIGGKCYSILKRTVVENGLSSYSKGSKYLDYDDCSEKIKKVAVDALKCLNIEMGSLDIIEGSDGFYIIDVNATSNFAFENIEMFGFNLIKDMAKYIVKRYGNVCRI